ncbi:MAG TPA: hypothetical protein VKB59_19795 [Micromonosporaceae bacterium]|nr:hypothetical protein [Micromonosporaceae bacterium]
MGASLQSADDDTDDTVLEPDEIADSTEDVDPLDFVGDDDPEHDPFADGPDGPDGDHPDSGGEG